MAEAPNEFESLWSAGFAVAASRLQNALASGDQQKLIFFDSFIHYIILNKPPTETPQWLDWLACGSEPKAVITSLQAEKSSVCGQVFHGGEYAYACEDCQMDQSCIICKACYVPEKHKGHRISVIKVGGGCCDCGDEEAWSPAGFCYAHGGHDSDEDPTANLPPALLASVQQVSKTILPILQIAICGGGKDSFDLCLHSNQMSIRSATHMVVLYDDNDHTFDEAAKQILRGCRVSQQVATGMTLRIDGIGHAIVFTGSQAECDKVADYLQQIQLKVATKPKTPLICIDAVQSVLKWLIAFVNTNEGILATILKDWDPKPLLSKYDVAESSIQSCLHDFLFAINKNRQFKIQFGSLISEMYPQLVDTLLHNAVKHNDSILVFTVQIFGQPNLTPKFVSEHKLLTNVLETMHKGIDSDTGMLDLDADFPDNLLFFVLHDLSYILSIEPVVEWMFDHEQELVLWLGVHASLQHVCSMVRKKDRHIEQDDPTWMLGLNMWLEMKELWKTVKTYLVKQPAPKFMTQANKLLALVLKSLESSFKTKIAGMNQCKLIAEKYYAIDYEMSKNPYTIHIPLQRFFLSLWRMKLAVDGNCDLRTAMSHKNDGEYREWLVELLDMPLRIMSLVTQVECGMWVRNGTQGEDQIFNYTSPKFRDEMFESDVALIQLCGAYLKDHDHFISLILNAFGAYNTLLNTNFTPELPVTRDPHQISLAEGALQLLNTIIVMRSSLGKMNEEAIVRENLVQWLWLGKMTHTSLAQTFDDADVGEGSVFRKTLSELASFSEASGFQQGSFALKPQYYKEYRPYWPFYRPQDDQTAQDKYNEIQDNEVKKQGKPLSELQHTPPPKLAPWIDSISYLGKIYHSEILHKVVFTTLLRARANQKAHFTPTLLRHTLHILENAILEVGTMEDNFFSATVLFNQKDSIVSLLSTLLKDTSFSRQHPITRWILQQLSKNPSIAAKIFEFSTEIGSEKKLTAEEERALRKQKALEARERATQKLKKTTQSLNEKLTDKEEPDQTVGEEKEKESGEFIECILCQQSHKNQRTHPFGVVSLVQTTALHEITNMTTEERKQNSLKELPKTYATTISSCGHFLHFGCYDKYINTILTRIAQRERFQGAFLEIEKGHFECPLCKQVSNFLSPIMDPSNPATPGSRPSSDQQDRLAAFLATKIKDPIVIPHQVKSLQEDPGTLKDMLVGMAVRVATAREDSIAPSDTSHTFLLTSLTETLKHTLFDLEISARTPEAGYHVDWNVITGRTKKSVFRFVEAILGFQFIDGLPAQDTSKQVTEFFEILNGHSLDQCLLHLSPLDILTNWITLVPFLSGNFAISELNVNFVSAVHLVMEAALVQSFLSACLYPEKVPRDSQPPSPSFQQFCAFVCAKTGLAFDPSAVSQRAVLLMSVAPLRQCAILASTLFDQDIPSVLETQSIEEEFSILLSFLGLPDLKLLLDVSEGSLQGTIVGRWASQLEAVEKKIRTENDELTKKQNAKQTPPEELSVKELKHIFTEQGIDFSKCLEKSDMVELFRAKGLHETNPEVVLREADWKKFIPKYFEPLPFQLMELPDNYIDLVIGMDESAKNVICLNCGTLLRAGEKVNMASGPPIGKLSDHATRCGGGQCIFLELQHTMPIAKTIHGVYQLPTPYLDQYGEVARGVKRGRVLTLKKERYERLRWLCVTHQIGFVDSVRLELANGIL